ncbi:hypothetical protein ILP92_10450 [Maribius pontilimi]|uniref:FlgN protein n=1 Tax=Palleronia pontilimi TaxID=1964209 RepID=A0A934I9V2_9RHOB|nr:hypothetical protein [Palleronia pontilimi]MBJ3763164.1 hypothetical protein [Palleronia pontilimi]
MSARACRHLLKLLDRERDFLIAGDVANAARLGDLKARLLGKIETGPADPEQISTIKRAAARNRLLIEAAERGVKSAHARLRALRDGVGVNVYSAQGQRQMITKPKTTLQKRA